MGESKDKILAVIQTEKVRSNAKVIEVLRRYLESAEKGAATNVVIAVSFDDGSYQMTSAGEAGEMYRVGLAHQLLMCCSVSRMDAQHGPPEYDPES